MLHLKQSFVAKWTKSYWTEAPANFNDEKHIYLLEFYDKMYTNTNLAQHLFE